jgi:fatty-acid desaturase
LDGPLISTFLKDFKLLKYANIASKIRSITMLVTLNINLIFLGTVTVSSICHVYGQRAFTCLSAADVR